MRSSDRKHSLNFFKLHVGVPVDAVNNCTFVTRHSYFNKQILAASSYIRLGHFWLCRSSFLCIVVLPPIQRSVGQWSILYPWRELLIRLFFLVCCLDSVMPIISKLYYVELISPLVHGSDLLWKICLNGKGFDYYQ